MKAALNGGLNLSILDGWWDECFDGENGWAISSAEHVEDLERRDEVEAGSLFELLERQVVPLFYERWQGPVPRRWVQPGEALADHPRPVRHRRPHGARLHASSSTSPPPRQGDALGGRRPRRAPATWRRGRQQGRGQLARASTSTTSRWTTPSPSSAWSARSGGRVARRASTPDDVEVQLLHGPAGQGEELSSTPPSCR